MRTKKGRRISQRPGFEFFSRADRITSIRAGELRPSGRCSRTDRLRARGAILALAACAEFRSFRAILRGRRYNRSRPSDWEANPRRGRTSGSPRIRSYSVVPCFLQAGVKIRSAGLCEGSWASVLERKHSLKQKHAKGLRRK